MTVGPTFLRKAKTALNLILRDATHDDAAATGSRAPQTLDSIGDAYVCRQTDRKASAADDALLAGISAQPLSDPIA